jgi:hypothetical protein
VVAGLVNLVLDSDLVQVREYVLDLGIGVRALGASEVVQPRPLVKQEVDDGNDDDDTDGVSPDDDHGDNAGVCVGSKQGVVASGVSNLVGDQPTE